MMKGIYKRPDFSGYESTVRTQVNVHGTELVIEYPSLQAFDRAYTKSEEGINAERVGLDNFTPGFERCVTAVMAHEDGMLVQIEFPGISAFKQGIKAAAEKKRQSLSPMRQSVKRETRDSSRTNRPAQEDSDNDEEHGSDSDQSNKRGTPAHIRSDPPSPGKNPRRVEGGKRAAEKRTHEEFQEMGRKGGKSRGERASDDGSDTDTTHHASDSGDRLENKTADGKNPNRVRGGQKAAESRGQQVHDHDQEVGYTDDSHHAADSGDKPENKTDDGKNPNRVAGGKKAAEKQGHDKLSENGKKGGHSSESYKSTHEQTE